MDTNKETNAQRAYKSGFFSHYIAKGASKDEAIKVANAAVAALKSASSRRESIRATILAAHQGK